MTNVSSACCSYPLALGGGYRLVPVFAFLDTRTTCNQPSTINRVVVGLFTTINTLATSWKCVWQRFYYTLLSECMCGPHTSAGCGHSSVHNCRVDSTRLPTPASHPSIPPGTRRLTPSPRPHTLPPHTSCHVDVDKLNRMSPNVAMCVLYEYMYVLDGRNRKLMNESTATDTLTHKSHPIDWFWGRRN